MSLSFSMSMYDRERFMPPPALKPGPVAPPSLLPREAVEEEVDGGSLPADPLRPKNQVGGEPPLCSSLAPLSPSVVFGWVVAGFGGCGLENQSRPTYWAAMIGVVDRSIGPRSQHHLTRKKVSHPGAAADQPPG